MSDISSFLTEIRDISGDLRLEPHSPVGLNRAAVRIDQLGRRVHGLGLAHDHEIGVCLGAAVRELTVAQGLPEAQRIESVREATRSLDAALIQADERVPSTQRKAADTARDAGPES